MARLTRKSPDLNELFRSDYTKPELARKLGLIEDRAEGLAEAVCETRCHQLRVVRDPEVMEKICRECPVTALMELIR